MIATHKRNRNMMKDFYFIRHAQTHANLQQVMCGGGVDTELTDIGLQQAIQAQEILLSHHENCPVTDIIHSDMKRTRKTAEILNQNLSLPVYAQSGLKEHVVGDWEGASWADILLDYTQFKDPPNGETFAFFQNRVKQGFYDCLDTYQTPLIVAHGGVWRAFLVSHQIIPKSHPSNAELFLFKFNHSKADFFPWDVFLCQKQAKLEKIDLS